MLAARKYMLPREPVANTGWCSGAAVGIQTTMPQLSAAFNPPSRSKFANCSAISLIVIQTPFTIVALVTAMRFHTPIMAGI